MPVCTVVTGHRRMSSRRCCGMRWRYCVTQVSRPRLGSTDRMMLVARWRRWLAGCGGVGSSVRQRCCAGIVSSWRRWAYLVGFRVLRAVAPPAAAVIGVLVLRATATGRRASRGECDGQGLAGRPLSASKSGNASTARLSSHPPTAGTDTRSFSQPRHRWSSARSPTRRSRRSLSGRSRGFRVRRPKLSAGVLPGLERVEERVERAEVPAPEL